MKRYDYRRVMVHRPNYSRNPNAVDAIEAALRLYGEKGWRLVCTNELDTSVILYLELEETA